MHLFDLTIVIPLVLLSIVTGLVVSFGTHWGLVRHWWILAKFALAVGIVTVASVWENYWVRGLVAKTAADRGAVLDGIDMRLAVCMVGFSVALWIATILSVYKPWGRTPWGQRRSRVAKVREGGSAVPRNTSEDSVRSANPVTGEV